MPGINYRELKQLYDKAGPQQTVRHLSEALHEGHLNTSDFSIRELAEAVIPGGREWVRSLDPKYGGGSLIQEAADAVDTTAFSNITGQIVYSEILRAYNDEAFICTRLMRNVPTQFNGEKIAGMARIGDKAETIHEGAMYPNIGFGEDWRDTPATTKRGFIVPVTKEAIFFDRTGLILERASEVGRWLGVNKEKRCADVMLGITNNYNWKGTAYNTYYATGDSGPWTNKQASNVLADWTNVDAAEHLFVNMLDPHTGEPIMLTTGQILIMPTKAATVRRILNATEVRHATDTAAIQTLSANPLDNYQVYTSRVAYRRLIANSVSNAADYWLMGDFGRAFEYRENWPITVVQAPNNSEPEFSQDIVARYKVSERGVAAVRDPRYTAMLYGS